MNKTLSTSNVIDHYRTRHEKLCNVLKDLNKENASETTIRARITEEKQRMERRRSNASIENFFVSRGNTAVSAVTLRTTQTPQKLLQSVAVIMFACATETPSSRISSPLLQGLIDVFGGRAQLSNKDNVEKMMFATYDAICRLLCASVRDAQTGCITVDGWSAALGAPMLGMTWHYVDEDWNLRCVPIATLNMGTVNKTGEQLRSLMEEVLEQNPIVGSENIRVHTATSDNEAATALAVDLLTNRVGSVRCVVHTLSLAVNDVFEQGTVWKKYLDHVNKVTTYFNHHQKAAQLLMQKQLAERVTRDRLQRLKHDIPTRWHSRLAAMSVHLCRISTILAVQDELGIAASDLPSLSQDKQDVLAEFITVLSEMRRVARQLEPDRKVSMSRAPRLLRELNETLRIMAGTMLPASAIDSADQTEENFLDDEDEQFNQRALPSRISTATTDKERDEARQVRLRKSHPQSLALRLADRVEWRLGFVWQRADIEAASWMQNSQDGEDPDPEICQSRRAILFHIAAVLDVNECSLEFLACTQSAKDAYMKTLYGAVVREAAELDSTLLSSTEQLEVVFSLFHKEMLNKLRDTRRKEPGAALSFWREANKRWAMISPVPFNTVARAALSSQASSAPAERLFSDLGRREGNQSQSLLSSTLEMTEMIRVFVCNALKENRLGQNGLLHPQARSFRRIVDDVSYEIAKQ